MISKNAQFDRVILADIQAERIKGVDTAATSLKDTKRLQYLLDQALRTSNMLDLNVDVMARLSEAIQNLNTSKQEDSYDNLIQELKDYTKDHNFLKKNLLSLISRTTILSNQVSIPNDDWRYQLIHEYSFAIQFPSVTLKSVKKLGC